MNKYLINKNSIAAIVLGATVISASLAPLTPVVLGATHTVKKVPVVGMAKFVARGSVVNVSTSSFTFHANSTSKNSSFLKAKDQVIPIGTNTKITKKGKKVAFSKLAKGAKVKIFGIFDKKSNSIVKVTWVKILP